MGPIYYSKNPLFIFLCFLSFSFHDSLSLSLFPFLFTFLSFFSILKFPLNLIRPFYSHFCFQAFFFIFLGSYLFSLTLSLSLSLILSLFLSLPLSAPDLLNFYSPLGGNFLRFFFFFNKYFQQVIF